MHTELLDQNWIGMFYINRLSNSNSVKVIQIKSGKNKTSPRRQYNTSSHTSWYPYCWSPWASSSENIYMVDTRSNMQPTFLNPNPVEAWVSDTLFISEQLPVSTLHRNITITHFFALEISMGPLTVKIIRVMSQI